MPPPWEGWRPEEIEAERIACAKIVESLYARAYTEAELAEDAEMEAERNSDLRLYQEQNARAEESGW